MRTLIGATLRVGSAQRWPITNSNPAFTAAAERTLHGLLAVGNTVSTIHVFSVDPGESGLDIVDKFADPLQR